jgi:HEAT repeat protein
MKAFHFTWAVILLFAACGMLNSSCVSGPTEKDAPLPPSNLEKREAAFNEVKSRLAVLKNADVTLTIAMLDHGDHRVRRAAVKRMFGFQKLSDEAVLKLGKMVGDENREVRIAALAGLSAMDDDRAVDYVIEALADSDSKVRMWAEKGIRKMEKRAVPVMVRHIAIESPISKLKFKDSANKTQTLSAMLLETLSGMGQSAVPYLIEIIKDPKNETAMKAVDVLGKIGSNAADSVPYLLRLLESTSDVLSKKKAIDAISNIGDMDPEVMPKLMELSDDSDSQVANAAKQALKKLEEDS